MSRLGRQGELKFSSLCTDFASAEVVVNDANDDQHGWDHIVEISRPADPTLPADLQAAPLQCFAQIKSTRGSSCSVKLKLSNAIKAAKSALPCFVFLVKYNVGGVEPEFYGRHVWKDEISHWLKRAREMELSENTQIHKKTVSMRFGVSDRITGNPIAWILEVLDGVGPDYAATKQQISKKVGYGKHSVQGTLNIIQTSPADSIVDLFLGLTPDLPFSNFVLHDFRFDILSKHPIQEFESGRVSITPTGQPVVLHLESSRSEAFDLPAQFFATNVVPYKDPQFKTRVMAGQIDFTFSPQNTKCKFDWGLDRDKKFTLVEQAGLLTMLEWLEVGSVRFDVNTDTGKLYSGTVSQMEIAPDWVGPLAQSSRFLVDIIGKKISGTIDVSLYELNAVHKNICLAASLLANNSLRIEAEFESEIEPAQQMVGYFFGSVADWSFGFVVAYSNGVVVNNAKRVSMYFSNPKIVKKLVFKQDEAEMEKNIVKEFDRYCESKTVPVAFFENGNLAKFYRKSLHGDDFLLEVTESNTSV